MIVKDLSKSFIPVPKQKSGQKKAESPVKSRQIKKKTRKLINLENNRFSLLTKNLEKCYLCVNRKEDLHEVYGGCNRVVSMKNGFVIPICRICHRILTDNPEKQERLQIKMQKEYEKTHTREEFIKLIKRNYIRE